MPRRRRANSRSAANAARRGRRASNAGFRRQARARYRPPKRPSRRYRVGGEQFAAEAAGRYRDHHRNRSPPTPCARRIDGLTDRLLGCARSTTPPAFMPRAPVWPKPTTSTAWLRGSEPAAAVRPQPPDQAGDLARADVERRDQRALRGEIGFIFGEGRNGGHSCVASLFRFLFLERFVARLRRGSDSCTVTRSGNRRSIEMSRVKKFLSGRAQPAARALPRLRFRQDERRGRCGAADSSAAPPQDRRPHHRADFGVMVEHRQNVLRARRRRCRRPAASPTSGLDEGLEHGAVGGDHPDAAVLLPERERCALLDR